MREKNAPDMTSTCSVKCPEVGDFLEKPPPERGWWQKQEREEAKMPQAAPQDEVSQAWLGGFAGPESPELPSEAADMLVFLRAGDGWSGCKVPSRKTMPLCPQWPISGSEKRASVLHRKRAPRGRMDSPCACWGGTILALGSLGTPSVLGPATEERFSRVQLARLTHDKDWVLSV